MLNLNIYSSVFYKIRKFSGRKIHFDCMGCITCVYLHVHTYEHMHNSIKHVLSVETIVGRIQGLNKYREKVSMLSIDYNDEGNYGQA